MTCLDCSTTFNDPASWKPHTSCISEAQKYQKSLYKPPPKHQKHAGHDRASHPNHPTKPAVAATPAILPSVLSSVDRQQQEIRSADPNLTLTPQTSTGKLTSGPHGDGQKDKRLKKKDKKRKHQQETHHGPSGVDASQATAHDTSRVVRACSKDDLERPLQSGDTSVSAPTERSEPWGSTECRAAGAAEKRKSKKRKRSKHTLEPAPDRRDEAEAARHDGKADGRDQAVESQPRRADDDHQKPGQDGISGEDVKRVREHKKKKKNKNKHLAAPSA